MLCHVRDTSTPGFRPRPRGKSLPAISVQLGHSSTAITDRYLRKIAPTELVAQVRDRSRLDA